MRSELIQKDKNALVMHTFNDLKTKYIYIT
jgi:hypothetical protein